MTEKIMAINKVINDFVWGLPVQILLIGTGLILVFLTAFVLYRKFGYILKNTLAKIFTKADVESGGVSPFQAVATALASTVGTGNIAGVATALVSGGPGAVFWMWIAALIGMTTKYAEVTLAVAYREKNEKGEYTGGPMYYIKNGLGMKWLAIIFATFGALASFGIGNMTQSNAIAQSMRSTFGIPTWIMGLTLAVFAAIILIGGIKRISQFAERIVPFMALFYILGGIVILIIQSSKIPEAFSLIFKSAFTKEAAAGGALGFTMMQAMRFGIARGIFTNEAGLGSAPIAHSAATTDHPARQGIWGTFEVFVDTILICTMTALVIMTSGLLKTSDYDGAVLTTQAFATGFNGGGYIVTFSVLLFAFTTILGWCYYGEKCSEYIFGSKAILPYRIVYICLIFVGAIGGLKLVWDVSDTLNGLMAIPNLIGVLLLSPVVYRLTKDFFKDPDRIRTSPEEFEHLLKRPNRK